MSDIKLTHYLQSGLLARLLNQVLPSPATINSEKDAPYDSQRCSGAALRLANQMNDEQTNFKVTDRRLFNSDGSPREVPANEKPEPQPTIKEEVSNIVGAEAVAPSANSQPKQHDAATTALPEPTESEDAELPGADDPASFVNFLMSIASNAASSLGMMEHPVTHQREVDLELSKHWIDVLGMLQHKTRGNVTPQEEKILEGFLSDLRMQFVSLANSGTPKAARPYSGRDIIGG